MTVANRPHPCLVEARQLEIVLAKLSAVLQFPDEAGKRPQRRAMRGVNLVSLA